MSLLSALIVLSLLAIVATAFKDAFKVDASQRRGRLTLWAIVIAGLANSAVLIISKTMAPPPASPVAAATPPTVDQFDQLLKGWNVLNDAATGTLQRLVPLKPHLPESTFEALVKNGARLQSQVAELGEDIRAGDPTKLQAEDAQHRLVTLQDATLDLNKQINAAQQAQIIRASQPAGGPVDEARRSAGLAAAKPAGAPPVPAAPQGAPNPDSIRVASTAATPGPPPAAAPCEIAITPLEGSVTTNTFLLRGTSTLPRGAFALLRFENSASGGSPPTAIPISIDGEGKWSTVVSRESTWAGAKVGPQVTLNGLPVPGCRLQPVSVVYAPRRAPESQTPQAPSGFRIVS